MKQSPILFNTDMVEAILDGRKTQTRRVFKDHSRMPSDVSKVNLKQWLANHPNYLLSFSPYGEIGDLLWIRETFAITTNKHPHFSTLSYKADSFHRDILLPGKQHFKSDMCEEGWSDSDLAQEVKWKPSIHMPKGFARIWLKITDIRVERLQEISETDAITEGLIFSELFNEYGGVEPHPNVKDHYRWYRSPITAFQNLWESTINKHSWKSNPWVWVITFERVEK